MCLCGINVRCKRICPSVPFDANYLDEYSRRSSIVIRRVLFQPSSYSFIIHYVWLACLLWCISLSTVTDTIFIQLSLIQLMNEARVNLNLFYIFQIVPTVVGYTMDVIQLKIPFPIRKYYFIQRAFFLFTSIFLLIIQITISNISWGKSALFVLYSNTYVMYTATSFCIHNANSAILYAYRTHVYITPMKANFWKLGKFHYSENC